MEYTNMLEACIIDPVKVVKTALLDAVSLISLVLSTKAATVETPKGKDESMENAHDGMHPGMEGF